MRRPNTLDLGVHRHELVANLPGVLCPDRRQLGMDHLEATAKQSRYARNAHALAFDKALGEPRPGDPEPTQLQHTRIVADENVESPATAHRPEGTRAHLCLDGRRIADGEVTDREGGPAVFVATRQKIQQLTHRRDAAGTQQLSQTRAHASD